MSTLPNFPGPNGYTVPANQVFLVNSVTTETDGNDYGGGYPAPSSPTGWLSSDGTTPFTSFTFVTQSDGDVNVYANTATVNGLASNDLYGTVTPTGDQSTNEIAFAPSSSPNGSGSILQDIVLSNTALVGSPAGTDNFSANLTNNGATFNTAISCYATGTMILTAQGEVPVESLKVGDLAITSSGEARAIRWIGHRHFRCAGFPQVNDVWPVRIEAGAFGPNLPNRDLLVSPGHGMGVTVVDELLIPAIRLVNGATIRQEPVDQVTYYHVELETPDVIVANGLPAETYIDVGNRASFITADAKVANLSFSEAAPAHIEWARPKLEHGPILQAVRERLAARATAAGWTMGSTLEGFHALVDGQVVQPAVHEGKARFLIPAGAQDVRLVVATSAPSAVEGTADTRHLGVAICGMAIDDGLTGRREIALDDPRLTRGFHAVEREPSGRMFRWTTGAATLPASLWEGSQGLFFLQLDLLSARPCWVAPARVSSASQAPLKLVSGL